MKNAADLWQRAAVNPAAPTFLTSRCGSGLKHTLAKAKGVCECNLVLSQRLLWVCVVCWASEMKAGLSNNSEFNPSAGPFMRAPALRAHIRSTGGRGAKEGNLLPISPSPPGRARSPGAGLSSVPVLNRSRLMTSEVTSGPTEQRRRDQSLVASLAPLEAAVSTAAIDIHTYVPIVASKNYKLM